MEKLIEREPIKVQVCDICGVERASGLAKCDICGKLICKYCGAVVNYQQVENVRGHLIGFNYDKIICQSHIERLDGNCNGNNDKM